MEKQAWSVAGAMGVQAEAHARMKQAIAEKRTFGIIWNGCRVGTCSSRRAAEAFVGKSKKYTIVADFAE